VRSLSLQLRIALGLAAAVLLLAIIVLVAYGSTSRLVASSRTAAAGREHILSLERLLSMMRAVETGQRGFLLTGDEASLAPYRAAVRELEDARARLPRLQQDRPGQAGDIRELDRLLGSRLEELESMVAAYRLGGVDSARALVRTGAGSATADSVAALLRSMEGRELDLLAASEATWRQAARRAAATQAALAAFALLLLAGLGVAVWRAVQERLRRETEEVRERETRRANVALDAEVAQRRKAEEEVRRLNADLAGRIAEMETLFKVIPTGIGIALDPACRDIRLNRALAQLLQLPEGENASKTGPGGAERPFRVVRYNGEEIPGGDLVMQRAARTGEPVINEAYRVVRPDGTAVDVLGSAAPLFDADGRVRGAVGAFVDVSERRRTEEQLNQAQRMQAVGQLAGGVAHDINNSMTTVLGFAEFASSRLSPDHPVAADLAEIRQGAHRAADIARQLLAFSRRQVSSPRPWRLDAVVSELRSTLERVVGAGVTLTVRCAPEPAFVRVDRSQLEQVLINLAANAADAMPDGGALMVETDSAEMPSGPFAVVSLRDTGHGMSEETRRRAFEPFFTTKRVGEGTGLGLAMVYGIVTEAGGEVRLESEPGRGTTATVLLPLLDADEAEQDEIAPTSSRWSPARADARRVLVVEDDASVRRLAIVALRSGGFQVESAGDGREALALLESGVTPPDLVITDVVMPHLSGRALRDMVHERHPGMPVLYISGYPGDEIHQRGLLGEDATFLQKPFSPDELVRRVGEVLASAGRSAGSRTTFPSPAPLKP